MPFTNYFTKNNAQGIVISDTSSTITFEAGHSFPTDVTSGQYLISLNPPSGEIVRVTAASEDVSGILSVTVTRSQEGTDYLDHSSGTMGYMLFTAGQFNNFSSYIAAHDTKLNFMDVTSSLNLNTMYDAIALNTAKISFDTTASTKVGYLTVTQAVNLDTLESDTTANNAKVTNATHTGDVIGATSLTIDPTAISGKTGVTPASGDYVLLWDATDSLLKKADVSSFLSGGGAVDSVNGQTGVVVLVTGNISDSTSTQKYTTAGDITKLSYISITQAVNLDTLESDTATNNAKVSNATHTGDVTGSGALTIDPTAISGKTGVTPVSGDYVLLWDATDSALKKADVSSFLSGGGAVDSVNGFTGVVTLVTGNISDTTSTQKYTTAADITKMGYISVTQAVDLDTMESNIATNNAKVTNANHTGDVTGSGVLTVDKTAITGKTLVTAASGDHILIADASDSDNLKKALLSDIANATHTGDVIGSTSLTIDPTAISGKTGVTPVAGDYVLLWDATDSLMKKADVTNFISAVTASSTTTFTSKRITKRVTTLTDSATIAINSDDMDAGKVTLTASRTLGTPTGTPTDMQTLLLEVVQGGSGSYTLTPDSTSTAGSYRFGSDVSGITLSTAVGKKDLILFTYMSDITGWACCSISRGYPA